MVGVLSLQDIGALARKVLDALVCLEMILDPVVLASLVVPLVGMAAVAVHMAVRCRRAAVRKEDCYLVHRFGR
jgi:hypothetical protein